MNPLFEPSWELPRNELNPILHLFATPRLLKRPPNARKCVECKLTTTNPTGFVEAMTNQTLRSGSV